MSTGRDPTRDRLAMAPGAVAEAVGTALLVAILVGSGIFAQRRCRPATGASNCLRTPQRRRSG